MGQLGEDWGYMDWSLKLANWRPDADDPHPVVVNWVWNSLTTDTNFRHWPANPATDPAYRDADPADLAKIKVDQGALDYGQRVRDVLDRFMRGGKEDLRWLRRTAYVAIEGVRIGSTELSFSGRGTLEYVHSYVTGTRDGPLGLFLAFLLDPERPFGQSLRRCRLRGCERFFFVPPARRGGPIPAFCPGTDHQRRHDARSSAKRAKEYRARQAVHAAAKHK
jgi:hypothetical protein